jgi:hypothetical protein
MKDNIVRGYYSDFKLNPRLKNTSALYPSHDHVTRNKNDSRMVLDSRVINDMKGILSKTEFWQVIEHLYAVGVLKKEINADDPKYHYDWKPRRNYSKRKTKGVKNANTKKKQLISR